MPKAVKTFSSNKYISRKTLLQRRLERLSPSGQLLQRYCLPDNVSHQAGPFKGEAGDQTCSLQPMVSTSLVFHQIPTASRTQEPRIRNTQDTLVRRTQEPISRRSQETIVKRDIQKDARCSVPPQRRSFPWRTS